MIWNSASPVTDHHEAATVQYLVKRRFWLEYDAACTEWETANPGFESAFLLEGHPHNPGDALLFDVWVSPYL